MDCNREEAVRARALAEQKLASQDYVSAKKYAMKAQQLFPDLDNMGHMMAVIDVHMAALVKVGVSNEMDWYGILQVEPNADEVVVKKQYRKLALFLHPDKNKFVGAESAFKLIGEASQVLSDKMKRLVYDAKRGRAHTRTSRTPVRNNRGSAVNKNYPEQNGHGAASTNAQHFKAARAQAQLHPFTFWTACPFCQMRYQYYRKFENQNLLCPQCRKAFLAKDLSRPNPAQAPFSQTEQPKAEPKAGTAGLNGHANGSLKFQNTTIPVYTTAADATNLPNGSKVAENAEAEKELRRKAHEFIRSMELQKELSRQKAQTFSTQAANVPHGSKAAEQAEVKVADCATNLSHGYKPAEKPEVKVADCAANLPHGSKAAEKAEVKVADCAANLPHGSKAAEKAEVKVADSSANLPNGTKAAENAKARKVPLRKAEDIRRLMEVQKELARRKEELKSTNATERNRGEPGQSKTEEQGGTTENIKKENNEKVSFQAKRKRGKKQYRSSSSSETEEENWEKMAADWKRDEHPRRSSRAKGNVTYKCNESDDDFQSTPIKKKARVEKEVSPPQHNHNSSDTSRKLEDLAKTAIRTKLNLQSTFGASMVHEAEAGNKACPEGEKKPKSLESEMECPNSTDGSFMATSCDVQDGELHNFDEGREEKDVEAGQVWALYDDKDGMPKYYMKVKKVQSRAPFQVLVGWFEVRKPSEEICELLDADFSVTCGEFIMSSSQIIRNVNSFSHLVNWEKVGKGIIRVYPKKGEIWCLYVDWKCGQQVFEVNDIPSMHCMVEVLVDCNEASGVTAMLLKKVEGYKMLFQSSNGAVIRVSFLEVLRFSHQVPAYKLKGNEAPNLPDNCWELDLAAVPSSVICPDVAASLHC